MSTENKKPPQNGANMRFIIRFYHGSRKPLLVGSERLAPFFPRRMPRLSASNTNPGGVKRRVSWTLSLFALAILLTLMFFSPL